MASGVRPAGYPLPAPARVLGRDAELSQIEAWLEHGAGRTAQPGAAGGVLVIEGEPGIGKTTVWAEAIRRARALGWQVLLCRPVPAEAGLPHVGLADLLRPVPDEAFGKLTPPLRRALRVALLQEEAGAGDLEPRAVGTGLAALLEVVTEDGPLLLAVDDAQWLDLASARSLAFALRRLGSRLPPATRDVLAALAASPGAAAGDLDLDALAPAERAGIAAVRPGGRVEFTHPLFGSALYSSLPEAERRRLHRALAGKAAAPEERARHLALAADGPDEATAAGLDRAAAAARGRGAADVAVELKELACQLTPAADEEARIRRSTELADLRYFAGDPTGARRELEQWLNVLPAGEERAQVLLELGAMRWVQGDASAGRELMTQALGEARAPALRAHIHARIASGADDADVTLEHGEAALALLNEHEDPQFYSFVLHIVALYKLYAGRGADHAAIEKGMRLQREAVGWDLSPIAAFWARNFDDFTTARQRLEDIIRVFREQGDEAQVCAALTHLATVEGMTGHMDRASALVAEALDLAAQTEQETYLDMALCAKGQVCAQAGDLAGARAAAGELLGRLEAHPDIVLEGMARIVLGLAALTAGDLAEADRQLSRADEIEELVHNREPANQRFQADHAEAVLGLGDTDRGERLVRRLEARAAALPRPWILAVSARCRGLLNAAVGDLAGALAGYQQALDAHQALDMPSELGRTLLALGRLHRRRNERQQAQECLARAVSVLEAAGALGWAAVARDELGRARGRRGGPEELTPTERTVCELAASGLRNQEIAARLFLSAKTVEANLSRGYRKLGVRSRTELAAVMAHSAKHEHLKP